MVHSQSGSHGGSCLEMIMCMSSYLEDPVRCPESVKKIWESNAKDLDLVLIELRDVSRFLKQ